MSVARRMLSAVTLTIVALGLSSCEPTPTGPGTGLGNGTTLVATVSGVTYAFDLDPNVVGYDEANQQVRFGGVVSNSGLIRTINASFFSDISSGTYPRTVTGDDVFVVYIENASGQNEIYDCSTSPDRCSITITGSNGQIVDGTFSAHLTNKSDASKTIVITGGRFSVKVR